MRVELEIKLDSSRPVFAKVGPRYEVANILRRAADAIIASDVRELGTTLFDADDNRAGTMRFKVTDPVLERAKERSYSAAEAAMDAMGLDSAGYTDLVDNLDTAIRDVLHDEESS